MHSTVDVNKTQANGTNPRTKEKVAILDLSCLKDNHHHQDKASPSLPLSCRHLYLCPLSTSSSHASMAFYLSV